MEEKEAVATVVVEKRWIPLIGEYLLLVSFNGGEVHGMTLPEAKALRDALSGMDLEDERGQDDKH